MLAGIEHRRLQGPARPLAPGRRLPGPLAPRPARPPGPPHLLHFLDGCEGGGCLLAQRLHALHISLPGGQHDFSLRLGDPQAQLPRGAGGAQAGGEGAAEGRRLGGTATRCAGQDQA